MFHIAYFISISFKCECYIIMQMQHSKNLNPERIELVTTLNWPNRSLDLFSLYVLFSHFRSRDATRGNSFFQMSSYARANVRITNDKNKRKIPMRASRGLKWENKMYKLKRSILLLF